MSKLFALHEHTLWVHGNGYENRLVGLVRDSMGIAALGRLHLCHDAEPNEDGVAQLQSGFLGTSQDVMHIYDDSRPGSFYTQTRNSTRGPYMDSHGKLTHRYSQFMIRFHCA